VTPREFHLLRAIEKTNRTKLTEMAVPSVDDVNANRVNKFTEAITQALGDSQIGVFRELVTAYEQEHDVPAADIAAAIAVLAQDGEPLLLDEMPEPKPQKREARSSEGMATYRIAVGRQQRVEPRMIVGALANEGGLKRSDFGRIEIKSTFSLVELPAELSAETLRNLRDTRISGELIDLKPDRGRPGRPHGGPKKFERRNPTKPAYQRKPRHKNK
jgi:ATP-dependent RNA helicase DeaD